MHKDTHPVKFVEEGIMNKVNYEIALKDVCDQELQILKRGCCSSIVKGHFYVEEGVCKVTAEVCGLFHLKTFLESDDVHGNRFETATKLYKDILGWLCKVTEAVLSIEEYLVAKNAVSIRLEDLYFESKGGHALLLLKPSKDSFFKELCSVCDEIFALCPQSNADTIRSRLESQNADMLLSPKDLLRFLSSWSCELNG